MYSLAQAKDMLAKRSNIFNVLLDKLNLDIFLPISRYTVHFFGVETIGSNQLEPYNKKTFLELIRGSWYF